MKYEILVEGGFTGIPKKYEGTIDLSKEAAAALVELMNTPKPLNIHLRDGFLYHVTLFDDEKSMEAQFEEKTLPDVIRQLISG